MRVIPTLLLLTCTAFPQFRSTSRLVIAPTTITDSAGHFIDGINEDDLILYDNNVPRKIQMDWTTYPIDLVVAVQASANSGAVIDKLGNSGILFTQLLAAEAGQTAMISYSDEVRVHQDFTSDADQLIHSMRMLRMEGDGAHILDALVESLAMLEKRPAGRRRIVLMIGEKRDRGSKTKLAEAMERVQKLNATVYWLTWSPFLQPFTVKPKTVEDTKPEAERIKKPACAWCPKPDDRGVPFDAGPGGLIYAIGELARLKSPELPDLFANATGGRTQGFLKKNALEQAVEQVAKEVHRQYILSFVPAETQPGGADSGSFHAIRVVVKSQPGVQVRTRAGYWALP